MLSLFFYPHPSLFSQKCFPSNFLLPHNLFLLSITLSHPYPIPQCLYSILLSLTPTLYYNVSTLYYSLSPLPYHNVSTLPAHLPSLSLPLDSFSTILHRSPFLLFPPSSLLNVFPPDGWSLYSFQNTHPFLSLT